MKCADLRREGERPRKKRFQPCRVVKKRLSLLRRLMPLKKSLLLCVELGKVPPGKDSPSNLPCGKGKGLSFPYLESITKLL